MKRKILVLTDHMPWGHRSIAKAIYNYLAEEKNNLDIEVSYVEVKAETGLGGDLYAWAYKNFPAGNRVAVKMFTIRNIRKITIDYSHVNVRRLREILNKYQPDLIISAYFLHSHALAKIRDVYGSKFKLWTVVADPWSINTLSFVEGADIHLVYDQEMVKVAKSFGINPKLVVETGWWTRREMFKKVDSKVKDKIRKKLGFSKEIPTIFVGGGSLGTSSMSMLLPILLTVRHPLQVIFNTGIDMKMLKTLENFNKMIKLLPRTLKNLKVASLGWIDNMAEVLSVCDVVMGKAGPNFLFDVVACGKPFVSITHIGGQEDGNIEIIKEKKLGWVAEDPIKMARFVRDFAKMPEYYKSVFSKTIRFEAEKNLKSFEKISALIKTSLH